MRNKQAGLSIWGLLFVAAILSVVALIAMQVVPDVNEYFGIVKAVKQARNSAKTPMEMRQYFDKQASVGYITTLTGKDLLIETQGDATVISFEYEKRRNLFGPVFLVIEYKGSSN